MARVFAYCMSNDFNLSDQSIFTDVSATIEAALKAVYAKNQRENHLAATAFEIALAKLEG